MKINPKHLNLSFAVLYALLLTFWIAKIYKHYFDFTLADQIALAFTALLALAIGNQFLEGKKFPWWLAITGSAGLPLAVFPMISELMVWISDTWIWLHAIQIIGILCYFLIGKPLMKSSPLLAVIVVWFMSFKFYPAQSRYYDRVVDQMNTRAGNIHVVKWKRDFWLHYNNIPQFSTLDAHMYAEALVHPSMTDSTINILILGGENLLAMQELTKYKDLSIQIFPTDPEYLEYMIYQKWLKLKIPTYVLLTENPFFWLQKNQPDLILIDFAEMNQETNAFYSQEFFISAIQSLTEKGRIVFSVGDPYIEKNKWLILEKTLQEAGFHTTNYHAQIPTIGETGFIIGSKSPDFVPKVDPTIPTRWLNDEALKMMLAYGKSEYFTGNIDSLNSIKKPSLIRYGKTRP